MNDTVYKMNLSPENIKFFVYILKNDEYLKTKRNNYYCFS